MKSSWRWMLGLWIWFPLVAAIALAVLSSAHPLISTMVWSRYLPGFLGAILSGIGMIYYFRNNNFENVQGVELHRIRSFTIWAGCAFGAYSVVSGLVVPEWGSHSMPFTQEKFYQHYGFPIQIVRAACVVVLSFAMRNVITVFEVEAFQRVRHAQNEAERAHDEVSAILKAIPDLLFEMDANGRYLRVEAMHEELLANSRKALLGHTVAEVLPSDAAEVVMGALNSARQNGSDYGRVIYLPLPDGEHWFELSVSRKGVGTHAGEMFIVLSHDITRRKRMEQLLQASEARYRLLAENVDEVIWTMDLNGRFTYISPSVQRLRGYTVDEAMKQSLADMLTPESLRKVEEARLQAQAVVAAGGRYPSYRNEFEQICKNGSTVWVEISTSPLIDDQGIMRGIVGVSRDITERRAIQDRIAHMAHHDLLTNLPNRALFSDRFGRALVQAKRKSSKLALMFVDLDKFKPVNDQYGHAVGDILLKEVANRMIRSVRESDTVGRMGGDEFVVLLQEIPGAEEARRVAEKIRQALVLPFEIDGKRLEIAACIGVAIYPDHGSDEVTLFHHADMAMYQAKVSGRNNVQVYRSPV